MIDLIQWRVCIGMWCGCVNSLKRKSRLVSNMQSHAGVQWMKYYYWEKENFGMSVRKLLSHTSVWLYTLTVFTFLQLILSGDVERNPGPVG